MDPQAVPELLKLLDHKDAAVRWWGATGLAALAVHRQSVAESARIPTGTPETTGVPPVLSSAIDPLRSALNDPAPHVRIAAAEGLAQLGRLDEALEALIAGLEDETPFIRLRAINVLGRLGEKARPALPAIRAAGMKDGHVAGYLGRMVKYLPERFPGETED
jgi:HEAT repeat protein